MILHIFGDSAVCFRSLSSSDSDENIKRMKRVGSHEPADWTRFQVESYADVTSVPIFEGSAGWDSTVAKLWVVLAQKGV